MNNSSPGTTFFKNLELYITDNNINLSCEDPTVLSDKKQLVAPT